MFSSKNNKGKHPTSKKVECFPILHTFSVSVLYKIPPYCQSVDNQCVIFAQHICIYYVYIHACCKVNNFSSKNRRNVLKNVYSEYEVIYFFIVTSIECLKIYIFAYEYRIYNG